MRKITLVLCKVFLLNYLCLICRRKVKKVQLEQRVGSCEVSDNLFPVEDHSILGPPHKKLHHLQTISVLMAEKSTVSKECRLLQSSFQSFRWSFRGLGWGHIHHESKYQDLELDSLLYAKSVWRAEDMGLQRKKYRCDHQKYRHCLQNGSVSLNESVCKFLGMMNVKNKTNSSKMALGSILRVFQLINFLTNSKALMPRQSLHTDFYEKYNFFKLDINVKQKKKDAKELLLGLSAARQHHSCDVQGKIIKLVGLKKQWPSFTHWQAHPRKLRGFLSENYLTLSVGCCLPSNPLSLWTIVYLPLM